MILEMMEKLQAVNMLRSDVLRNFFYITVCSALKAEMDELFQDEEDRLEEEEVEFELEEEEEEEEEEKRKARKRRHRRGGGRRLAESSTSSPPSRAAASYVKPDISIIKIMDEHEEWKEIMSCLYELYAEAELDVEEDAAEATLVFGSAAVSAGEEEVKTQISDGAFVFEALLRESESLVENLFNFARTMAIFSTCSCDWLVKPMLAARGGGGGGSVLGAPRAAALYAEMLARMTANQMEDEYKLMEEVEEGGGGGSGRAEEAQAQQQPPQKKKKKHTTPSQSHVHIHRPPLQQPLQPPLQHQEHQQKKKLLKSIQGERAPTKLPPLLPHQHQLLLHQFPDKPSSRAYSADQIHHLHPCYHPECQKRRLRTKPRAETSGLQHHRHIPTTTAITLAEEEEEEEEAELEEEWLHHHHPSKSSSQSPKHLVSLFPPSTRRRRLVATHPKGLGHVEFIHELRRMPLNPEEEAEGFATPTFFEARHVHTHSKPHTHPRKGSQ